MAIGTPVSRIEKTKRVIVYRNDLLPMSETFVREQFTALQDWRGTLVGMHRASPSIDLTDLDTQIFPLNSVPVIGGLCTRAMRLLALEPTFVERWLAGLQAHLVHVHFGIDAVALWPAVRRLQTPMVVTLHGYDITIASAWWQAGLGGKRHRNYHQTLIEMSRDRRVHFVAVSRTIRERAIQLGIPEDKVRVLHIGIDTEAFIPGPVPLSMRPSRILFVGRLVEKKGCDVLIRAVHQLMPMVPGVEVVIVGDGPLRGELERLAAQLSVPVYFAGSMARDEVKQQLDRARVFCLPSIVAENGDAEGFGLVLLEAQACGVPVVTSAQGGASEGLIEGVTGLSFPEKDVATLAKQLSRLLTDDECIMRMSDAAPRFVAEHFDVRNCTRALEGLYDELVRVQR
ncbi:MAG: glycosyltransferase [Betaproteobacteria bacterium]